MEIDHERAAEKWVTDEQFAYQADDVEMFRVQMTNVDSGPPDEPGQAALPVRFIEVTATRNASGGGVNLHGKNREGFPTAFVYSSADELRPDLRWRQIQLFFLPFHPSVGLLSDDGSDVTVLPESNLVGGHECVLLRKDDESVWVTDDERFLPIRYTLNMSSGTLLSDVRVSYQNSELHGWVPSGWTRTDFSFAGTEIVCQWKATVTDVSLNEDLDLQQFDQQEFPAGTWVTYADEEKASYIVRAGRPNRIAGPNEGVDDYRAMLQTDQPVQQSIPAAPRSSFVRTVLWVNLVIAGVILLYMSTRRKRAGS